MISIFSPYYCQRHQPDFHNSYFVLCFVQTVDVYRAQSGKEERQKEITGEFFGTYTPTPDLLLMSLGLMNVTM